MNKIVLAILAAFSIQAHAAATSENFYQVTAQDCEGVRTIAEGAQAAFVEKAELKSVQDSLIHTPDILNPGYRAMLPSILKAVRAVHEGGDVAINNSYQTCVNDIGKYYHYYTKG